MSENTEAILKKLDLIVDTLQERVDAFHLAYPTGGGTKTLPIGKTSVDFYNGSVIYPDGTRDKLPSSLKSTGIDYIRSCSLNINKPVIVNLDTMTGNMSSGRGLQCNVDNHKFRVLYITATEETEASVWASSEPDNIFKKDAFTAIVGNYTDEDGVASPVTVSLDGDGNIVSVMKGLYSGGLETVALDGEGRMQTVVQATIGFDLPLLMYDSFDTSPFQWGVTGTGADYYAGRSQILPYRGSFCCRMKTKETAPAAGDYVNLRQDVACSDVWTTHFTMLFKILNPCSEVESLIIGADRQFGDLFVSAAIKYNPFENKWYYLNELGVYVEFLEHYPLCNGHWHRFTFITDAEYGTYGIATVDDKVVDLTDKYVYVVPNPGADNYLDASVRAEAAANQQVIVDIDHIIIKTM